MWVCGWARWTYLVNGPTWNVALSSFPYSRFGTLRSSRLQSIRHKPKRVHQFQGKSCHIQLPMWWVEQNQFAFDISLTHTHTPGAILTSWSDENLRHFSVLQSLIFFHQKSSKTTWLICANCCYLDKHQGPGLNGSMLNQSFFLLLLRFWFVWHLLVEYVLNLRGKSVFRRSWDLTMAQKGLWEHWESYVCGITTNLSLSWGEQWTRWGRLDSERNKIHVAQIGRFK